MNITLFTYDRPHWKTQQFLYELVALGHTPVEVIGAPWREDLRLPSTVRMTCRHLPQHPAEVCRVLGIRYTVKPHADAGPGDLGVIGGARILPKDVVSSFSTGILNMHPGRIPDNRGLS